MIVADGSIRRIRSGSIARLVVALLPFVLPSGVLLAVQDPVLVVPRPKSITPLHRTMGLPSMDSPIIILDERSADVSIAIQQVREEITRKRQLPRPPAHAVPPSVVVVGLYGHHPHFDASLAGMGIVTSDVTGDEGYVLAAYNDTIRIAAQARAGLFYGMQTLRQLIRGSNGVDLLAVVIRDWPDFALRILQDDISRGPVPTLAFMKSQIERAAELKYNGITYYTEHVATTTKHGAFAPFDGSISIEEWKQLDAFAADRHMQLIGNFQSFGHFENILAHPSYTHLGEGGRMLSPALPESYDLLREIYAELAPAFRSELFLVNCDEVFDLGRGYSRRMVDSLGIARVYASHIRWIRDELRRHGKRPLVWADMALQHPEIFGEIQKDIVLMPWEYSFRESYDSMIRPVQDAGFEVIVAPGVLNSRRLFPDFNMARSNIQALLSDARRLGVTSMLLTTWDDGGGAFFTNDWYGVAFAADQAWGGSGDPAESFDARWTSGVYGDPGGGIAEAIHLLNTIADLEPTSGMNDDALWDIALPRRGERMGITLEGWESVIAICDSVDTILDACTPTAYTGDISGLRLVVDLYRFSAAWRFTLIEASRSYASAVRHQRSDSEKMLEQISAARGLFETLAGTIDSVSHRYQRLWERENQPHFLDRILEHFDDRRAEIDHILRLMDKAAEASLKGYALPPPLDVRLAIDEVGGGYLRSWMICGPFEIGPKGVEEDFLRSMGGELSARPSVWVEVEIAGGESRKWKKVTSRSMSEVDLAAMLYPNTVAVAYAYCRLTADRDMTVRATFGSNDGIDVILNGARIFSSRAKRGLIPDEEEVVLDLKEGTNHLLLKVDQNKGGWGFSFRLPDVPVRGMEYKYRITDEN